jgi:8-amino-3,8-dideoxy-alpha-D-manno-octulosonate transaminase
MDQPRRWSGSEESEGKEILALHGGPPARKALGPSMFPGANAMGVEEEQAVLEVIRTKRLFRYYGPQPGPSKVAEFETEFAAKVKAAKALAVSSGTAALICSLAAIGVGPGDEVIVPAYTWIASAFAVMSTGAIPILAEVDDSLTLDPADVKAKITPRTKAILPVHMRGAPACMEELCQMASQYELRVIEDVAQAVGGSYKGRPLGSIGDLGCFSLQFHKVITCGEGGVVVSSDELLHRRALMFHDPIGGRTSAIPSQEILLGANFRMSELSGAIALVQLRRLDTLIETMKRQKKALVAGITESVTNAGGRFRRIIDQDGDTSIALIFFLPTAEIAEHVVFALKAENIRASNMYRHDQVDYHVYSHWTPILEKRTWTPNGGPWRWSSPVEYTRDMCPRTLDLLGRAVHLDVNPILTEGDVLEIIYGLNKVLKYV